jgi:hypothetical protein
MTAIAKLRAPLPSLAERMAAGKALRAKVPRKSHGDSAPAPDRRDQARVTGIRAPRRARTASAWFGCR